MTDIHPIQRDADGNFINIDDVLDRLIRSTGRAPRSQVLSSSFYGLNTAARNDAIPLNTEDRGYTFFSRPQLNLSYDNISADRVLSTLAADNPLSVQRMVRCLLDPTLQLKGIQSPGTDPLMPFVPLLSNNLVSLTGFPDLALNTVTSEPGIYRESSSYVDDIPYNYESYDLNASFRNIDGDPISFMFLMWEWYQGLVYEGKIMAYPDAILYKYLDYTTRIWRIVLDKSRNRVTRIGACGASFPTTVPIGNIFNYQGDGAESPYTTANDQINLAFRATGFTYHDPVLIYEFNTLVQLFNPLMRDNRRENSMIILEDNEQNYMNFSAYPRIDPETMNFEWWIERAIYEELGGTKTRDGDGSVPIERIQQLREGLVPSTS